MEPITETLGYPMESDSWLMTVLIGGVLLFLSFLFLPVLLVYGYVVQVLRARLQRVPQPPSFENWEKLFVDGLKAFVIGFVYMLVPAVVLFLTVGTAFVGSTGSGSVGVASATMLFGFAVAGLLGVALGYVAVAGLVNFAREDRIGAAFEFGTLKTALLNREYAMGWLAALLVAVVAGMVAAIPLIGWLLSPFVSFYAVTVAANFWATGFAAAFDDQRPPESVGSAEPVS
ncbi:MAG: DUF4013 domain-containing protein [Haloferacaceae archaeon]